MTSSTPQVPDNLADWPLQLKMSRLPFMLQGWNCTFYKTGGTSEGCPIYRLDPYTLYWTIPIIGVRILKVNGRWIINRDCDYSSDATVSKLYNDQASPIGF